MGNVFNRYGAGGGKSEGLYIWKKYEYVKESISNPAITIAGNYTYFRVYESGAGITTNIDLSKLPQYPNPNNDPMTITSSDDAKALIEFFNGFETTNLKFELWQNQIRVLYNGTYNGVIRKFYKNGQEYQIHISESLSNTSFFYMAYNGIKDYPPRIGDFVGFVVSDKEDAYPDKEVKDGYYYEKVGLDPALFGCTKMEVGTFTPTSNLANYSVNHNLGVIPKMALVWSDTATYNIRTVQSWNTSNGSTGSASVQSTEYYVRTTFAGSGSATVTTLILYAYSDTSYRFQSGKKYHYVLFA